MELQFLKVGRFHYFEKIVSSSPFFLNLFDCSEGLLNVSCSCLLTKFENIELINKQV